MAADQDTEQDSVVINEVKLILAEHRTALAVLRTGIAITALPLAVMSFLVATSKFYNLIHVVPLIVPILLLCAALAILGVYLITKSVFRMRRHDRQLLALKREHRNLAEFID